MNPGGHATNERTCPNCGSWLSPAAVSCDVCGTVLGSSAPLSSDGGSLGTPTVAHGYPGAGANQPPFVSGAIPGAPAEPPPGYPGGYGAVPPYGYPGAPGVPGYYPQQTNNKAITALVLGIVGLVVCQIASVFAIIIGGQARDEIRYSGGMQTGESMATAGRILGWVGVGIFCLAIIAIIFIMVVGVTATPS